LSLAALTVQKMSEQRLHINAQPIPTQTVMAG
jgi:hypothetical protein